MSDKVVKALSTTGVAVSLALMAAVLIAGTIATAIAIVIIVALVLLLGVSLRALWVTNRRQLPR